MAAQEMGARAVSEAVEAVERDAVLKGEKTDVDPYVRSRQIAEECWRRFEAAHPGEKFSQFIREVLAIEVSPEDQAFIRKSLPKGMARARRSRF